MIDEQLIFIDSSFENKEAILDFLSDNAQKNSLINNKENFIKAVEKREEEFSTAIGYSVSIPHGKSSEVRDPFISFLRLKNEVIWDKNGNKVLLVFLIGVPEDKKNTLHLKILAEISKKLLDENFRNSLINEDKETILSLLYEIENKIILGGN